MRREAAVAGFGFWFLVAAFLALLGGRARAQDPAAPAAAAGPAVPARPAGAAVPASSAGVAVAAPAAGAAAPALSAAPAVPALPAPVASAPPANWGPFKGQVVFSDVLIAPASQFPTPAAMMDALRRLKRTTVEGSEGFWRLHMVAFLEGVLQSGAGTYELRATDVTDPKDRRAVRTFDVEGLPNQTELPINDLVVTEVMGFERGHRYEMAVVRRTDGEAGGKADVCAKGVITLM